jgi:hypothetical protein
MLVEGLELEGVVEQHVRLPWDRNHASSFVDLFLRRNKHKVPFVVLFVRPEATDLFQFDDKYTFRLKMELGPFLERQSEDVLVLEAILQFLFD